MFRTQRVKRTVVAAAVAALALSVSPLCPLPASRAEDAAASSSAGPSQGPAAQAQATVDKALDYLKGKQQADGGWQNEKDFPALTAVVLTGMVRSGRYSTKDDFVRKGYEKLLSFQHPDNGGIYQDALANYNDAISVSALAAANDPAFKERMDKAVAYLKHIQWVPGGEKGAKGEEVTDQKNPWYGGWGYGNHARPDLSNAHFSIEALKDAGLKEDDPAFKAAVQFVTRCQNDSETNDEKWAGDDGGFVYGPGNGEGTSEADDAVGPDGRKMWRSYGSMTYAGLKSLLYAGVKKDDPRVKAAFKWIQNDFTVDENPGMRLSKKANAKHGLYYYYNVYAKALAAYGEPVITDSKGVKHDWRAELIRKLAETQQPDGSWVGESRWFENDPVLATAYAVQAMEHARDDLKAHP